MSVTSLLHHWLSRQTSLEGLEWLEQKRQQIVQGAPARVLFAAFSAVPRQISKEPLQLTTEDWQAIARIRPGWNPKHWSLTQTARTLLVLSLPERDAASYQHPLEQLFNAADIGELVALYQALPLLPYPEQFRLRAAEGLRSNITAVFNAVALRNPYPSEYFDDGAWNQLVLKALFVDSPLHLIHRLDQRTNPELAQMLIDYAHERWSAQRSVSPELWRAVGSYGTLTLVTDLERLFAQPDPTQKAAAALACAQSNRPEAQALLASHPDLESAVRSGRLTWDNFLQLSVTKLI
ncbi:MAG: EboA family metabolite traffic protein [Cyanophyceae cyanobacterium]